jgi:hypothetical protein
MARQQRSTIFAPESTRTISRVALYARVSTLNNQDPELQLAELREYAGRRGWRIIDEYVDHGFSGCKESRPALNRLMSDACRRRFDAILVWKIDRFGRSLKHLVNALAELAALGVAFISLRDNLDLSTPSGRRLRWGWLQHLSRKRLSDVSDRDSNHVWRKLPYRLPNVVLAIGIRAQRQQSHVMPSPFSRSRHTGEPQRQRHNAACVVCCRDEQNSHNAT